MGQIHDIACNFHMSLEFFAIWYCTFIAITFCLLSPPISSIMGFSLKDDDIKQLKQLASDLLMPELERQLQEDPSLIPNMKALFVLTIVQKRKPMATW